MARVAVGRVLLASLLLALPAMADIADAGNKPAHSGTLWQAWSGNAHWRFNTDVLAAMGLAIDAVADAEADSRPAAGHAYRSLRFAARTTGALTFRARGERPDSLVDGRLDFRGGFVLRWPDGHADLRGFVLRPHAGGADEPFMMQVTDSAGRVAFLIDHAHYSMADTRDRLLLRDMNVRVAPQLALRMGRSQWAGRTIGSMDVEAMVARRDGQSSATVETCSAPWPTEAAPGQVTNIKIYQKTTDRIQAMRCHLANGGNPELGANCPASGSDGLVVIAPDSSLVNAGDTAVPWYRKFNANRQNVEGEPQPPYNNDQHPFLVWNLYRIDAGGDIRQIGRSAVKHAFWAANQGCSCTTTNYHVIFPQCRDTYSVSNNDDGLQLAPRSELIPALGIWGRCGSVYDRDCDGHWDHDGNDQPVAGAANDFDLRLVASERDLLPALNPGARFYFEYWYLVRDDSDVHDTMGYREVLPNRSAGNSGLGDWSFPAQALQLGPAINAWVDPLAPGVNQASQERATDEGHVRVAVRVDPLPDGRWRYRYAAMNLDFARAVIDPAHASEPDLKLLSNAGFDAFAVPVPDDVTLGEPAFTDADHDDGNGWTSGMVGSSMRWQAPAGNTLDWGNLYTFSFVASTPPGPAAIDLHVANTGTGLPASYSIDSLAPRSEGIFADGFESAP